jgi:hypothetical protein
MQCQRCGGLMVTELYDGVKEYAFPSEAPGTRCINCGNIEDTTIYANRAGSQERQRTARGNIVPEVKAGCCRH